MAKTRSRSKRTFTVDYVPIDTIAPYHKNPRESGKAVPDVARSLANFDWQQPIVVDTENVIIVGHARYFAAKELGEPEVPVKVADNLSLEQVKAYRLADNRTGENATWVQQLLVSELSELEAVDAGALLPSTGFTDRQLDKFLKPKPEATATPSEPNQPRPVPTYQCPQCGYKWGGAAA